MRTHTTRSVPLAATAIACAAIGARADASCTAPDGLQRSVTLAPTGDAVLVDVYVTWPEGGNWFFVAGNTQLDVDSGAVVHAPCCPGWAPCYADDPCLVDSFVTIGGLGEPDATAADPNWGPAGFDQPTIPNLAGWWAPPPLQQGMAVRSTLRVYDAAIYAGPAARILRIAFPIEALPQPVAVSWSIGWGPALGCPGDPVDLAGSWTIAAFGDLDGDGAVGGSDVAVLLAAWNERASIADLDGDGVVGAGDLGVLLSAWG